MPVNNPEKPLLTPLSSELPNLSESSTEGLELLRSTYIEKISAPAGPSDADQAIRTGLKADLSAIDAEIEQREKN